MRRITILFLIFCAFQHFYAAKAQAQAPQEENLNVFATGFDGDVHTWIEWSDAKNMLIHHLNKQAFSYLDKRDEEVASINTREEWNQRQAATKKKLIELVGPFPEKTPLNAKITGIVRKDGFRIEKIVYESMPGFYVTACLFIPDKIKGKRPAVIQVSGHGTAAFRARGTQTQLYNLVKKGFIVFAIDPIHQGERLQYWDESSKKFLLGTSPTAGHGYYGSQMLISGISPIRYFVWDGIRGVDYLLSRKEVDPGRIGIYGCSGGGTQTTFIAAMDERIKVAVPGCFITDYRILFSSIGAQDAEQNVYHGIKNGLTYADILESRAPKPLLISSTTRDYFNIQGAMDTYDEVRKMYGVMGAENNARQVIDDWGHGLAGNITTIYGFFQEFLDNPGSSDEIKFEGFAPEELQVTPTGQVATSLKGETAFSVCARETGKMIDKLVSSRKNVSGHLETIIQAAEEISGYTEQPADKHPIFRGRYRRDGYNVELYAIHGEGNYIIPVLIFIPSSGSKFPAIIYLHPKGKSTDALPGGKIEKLVKAGYVVAAADVLGTGETYDNFYGSMYLAGLVGRSIPGIQAGDIGRVAAFLKTRNNIDGNNITGMAFNELCPAMLHAAAMNKNITSALLDGCLTSYRDLVMNEYYETRMADDMKTKSGPLPSGLVSLSYTVTGALTAYDLPDLIGSVAPRKIALVGLKDHMKLPASADLVDMDMAFPKAAYEFRNASGNLRILPATDDIIPVLGWLRN